MILENYDINSIVPFLKELLNSIKSETKGDISASIVISNKTEKTISVLACDPDASAQSLVVALFILLPPKKALDKIVRYLNSQYEKQYPESNNNNIFRETLGNLYSDTDDIKDTQTTQHNLASMSIDMRYKH